MARELLLTAGMSNRSLVQALEHGAIAGVIGASTMTVLRMLAHRAGWVQQMVPQAVEAWVQRGSRSTGSRDNLALRHVSDQLLHFAYGATWGAAFGAARRRVRGRATWLTLGFGLGQWAFGSMLLFPALGIGKPAWRSGARENAVNVAAHLLYAGVSAFLLEEYRRQENDQPRSYLGSRFARVG